MSLTPGQRLGPYEIVSALGAGGMGEVYKARDTRLDRTVAIKVLPEHVAADPALKLRFEREAKTLAALSHPHICPVFDVGRHDGVDFLVMEYLEGDTLAVRLAKGALPIDRALAIAIQIADALDKAHRAGIVHRDLKPGNIMLTKSGAKLLDFGLAKATPAVVAASGLSVAPTFQTPVTMQGTILGTLQYMAPEQVEGQEADPRTDIFAFGAVFYEMVTGKRAFDGKTQASVIASILDREPPSMSSLQPLAPSLLDRTIAKCLAKDPDARWQTIRDVRDQLGWFTTGAALDTSTRRAQPRTLWTIAIAGVVGLAVMAAIAIETVRGRPATTAPPLMRFDIQTGPSADVGSFAVSPDGRSLLFVATDADGSERLWLRSLDQTAAKPLAGTEGASFPFWSPDGRSICFFADLKLKRLDLDGGIPRDLADARSGRGGTWNTDNIIVFTPATVSGLMSVPANGGEVSPVLRSIPGQPGLQLRWPQFLPDQRHFLFYAYLNGPGTAGTYVSSLDGAPPTRVVEGTSAALFAPPDHLLAIRQKELMSWAFDPQRAVVAGEPVAVADAGGTDDVFGLPMFSVSSTGVVMYRIGNASQRRQLTWKGNAGNTLGVAGPVDLQSHANPELSPDGRTVATQATVDGNVDVWLLDLNRGVRTRFTFDPAGDVLPLWSPDGNRIAFGSARKAPYDLFEKPVSGAVGDERPLLETANAKRPHSWSSDGRYLLYQLDNDIATGSSDLWVLPLTGKRDPFPAVRTKFNEAEGQFSPDGHWLAYGSDRSGRFEVYVQHFPEPGEAVQVSSGGGTQVRWSPDGKKVYYIAPDQRLMEVALAVGQNGSTIQAAAPAALFMTHLATGGNVTGGKPQYVLSRDGRFLMDERIDDKMPPPITVMLNWQDALKR